MGPQKYFLSIGTAFFLPNGFWQMSGTLKTSVLKLKRMGTLSLLKQPAIVWLTCWRENLQACTWHPLPAGFLCLQNWNSEIKEQRLDWKIDVGFPTLSRWASKGTSFLEESLFSCGHTALWQQGPFNSLCGCACRWPWNSSQTVPYLYISLWGERSCCMKTSTEKHAWINDWSCILLLAGRFSKDTD